MFSFSETLRKINRRQRRLIVVIGGGILLGATGFQNCSQALVGYTAEAPSQVNFLSSTLVTINNGKPFTKDAGVKLQVQASLAGQMYVTNDATCETGGVWEDIRSERPWTLAQTDGMATVYVKFRAPSGAALSCMNASIIHDDIAPKLSFVNKPAAFTNAAIALHSLTADDHGGSGIDHYECQLSSAASFQTCPATVQSNGLVEGAWHMRVRGVDHAGNVSSSIDSDWVIDQTPPTVKFTQAPSALNNQSNAIFRFEASDAVSGVSAVSCELDVNGVAGKPQTPCTSPVSLNGLGSVSGVMNYRFTIWANDNAGNRSDMLSYVFSVDQAPSGAFDVLGVSGGNDTSIDSWLGTVANPTVSWTLSNAADHYLVSILNSAGNQTLCTPATVSGTTTSFTFPAACALSDGQSYKAQVTAVSSVGNLRTAALFPFTVDLSAPVNNVSGPILTNDDKDAKFNFTLSDVGAGIAAATCTRNLLGGSASTAVSVNCNDLTSLQYTGLVIGSSYTFQISATDKAGNVKLSTPVTWKINQVVCDPFGSGQDQTCKKGLRANLYYLSETQKAAGGFNTASSLITQGTQANVTLYLSQLFVPQRSFSDGFVTTDGSLIRDNAGQTLLEWFALDLQTVVKLDPAMEGEGKYQFAILSDDGAVVEVKDPTTLVSHKLIDNDGGHAAQLGCDLTGIDMKLASRIPMHIQYFQGPRYHIAVALLWRPFPSDTRLIKDSECGVGRDVNYFFGDVSAGPANLLSYAYGQMLQRGWKPLQPGNFILNEQVTP